MHFFLLRYKNKMFGLIILYYNTEANKLYAVILEQSCFIFHLLMFSSTGEDADFSSIFSTFVCLYNVCGFHIHVH